MPRETAATALGSGSGALGAKQETGKTNKTDKKTITAGYALILTHMP
jgi:hypothetical protein